LTAQVKSKGRNNGVFRRFRLKYRWELRVSGPQLCFNKPARGPGPRSAWSRILARLLWSGTIGGQRTKYKKGPARRPAPFDLIVETQR
jgi:hypothetical protein